MDSTAHTKTPPWSNLPSELLELISKRLDTRLDLLRFRAICTAWRSSVPSHHFSHKLPFRIDPDFALNSKRRGHLTLTKTTIYCIEPLHKISNPSNATKTWLVKVEESEPGKVCVKDPLSWIGLEHLPKNFPRVLNLLDYRVSEIGKIYNLQFVNLRKKIQTDSDTKVAVSSNSDDFSVLVVHSRRKLALWKLGDKEWTNIHNGRKGSNYVDVAYHNGKFYALDSTGLVKTVDSSLKKMKVAAQLRFKILAEYPPRFPHLGQFKYLVKSCGDLYLVDKYVNIHNKYSCSFKIYRLNEKKKEWIPVYSLGDRVFFVGDDGSYSISAQDFSGCKANSVYFNKDSFSGANDSFPGCDAWIFDLKDRKRGPLSDFPGYSKIFWPPPIWLKGKPECAQLGEAFDQQRKMKNLMQS